MYHNIAPHIADKEEHSKKDSTKLPESRSPKKSSSSIADSDASENGMERTGRWSDEEHQLFLEGLSILFGGRWSECEYQVYHQGLRLYNKNWKKLASIVKTRTVVQVRTHAQKFFGKLEKVAERNQHSGKNYDFQSPFSYFDNPVISSDQFNTPQYCYNGKRGHAEIEYQPPTVDSNDFSLHDKQLSRQDLLYSNETGSNKAFQPTNSSSSSFLSRSVLNPTFRECYLQGHFEKYSSHVNNISCHELNRNYSEIDNQTRTSCSNSCGSNCHCMSSNNSMEARFPSRPIPSHSSDNISLPVHEYLPSKTICRERYGIDKDDGVVIYPYLHTYRSSPHETESIPQKRYITSERHHSASYNSYDDSRPYQYTMKPSMYNSIDTHHEMIRSYNANVTMMVMHDDPINKFEPL